MSMDLPEAIGRTLDSAYAPARVRPTPAAPTTPGGILDALKAAYGVTGAAKAAGVDRRTFQRGQAHRATYKPRPGTLDKLRGAYDRLRADQERQEADRARAARRVVRAGLVAKGGRLAFQGTVCVSNDCRPRRRLDMSAVFTGSTRASVLRAYERSDLEQAADAFNAGLNRDYVGTDPTGGPGDMYVQDVDWMEWR